MFLNKNSSLRVVVMEGMATMPNGFIFLIIIVPQPCLSFLPMTLCSYLTCRILAREKKIRTN